MLELNPEKKICPKCGPPAQPIEQFAWRSKARGTRQYMCRTCQRAYTRDHYKANRSRYIQKAKLRNIEQSKVNAQFLIDYLKEHPCVDCGEDDIVVLEFDHQQDKLATVSEISREGYSLKKLRAEISKCEVVCANCHRRRTAKQYGWYRMK
jgi:hypothetical protein